MSKTCPFDVKNLGFSNLPQNPTILTTKTQGFEKHQDIDQVLLTCTVSLGAFRDVESVLDHFEINA